MKCRLTWDRTGSPYEIDWEVG